MGGLGFYSVWPMLLVLLGLFALAATPLFRAADVPPASAANTTASRLLNMDGLRGFLALAVVLHHAALYHMYLVSGEWAGPPYLVVSVLGSFGTNLFFMITGFLFWSQLLRAGDARHGSVCIPAACSASGRSSWRRRWWC